MPDPNLYLLALTHSSWANEHGGPHNERLEFLGDAVLQLCTSKLLYARLGQEREDELSRVRQRLVGKELLARLALDLGLERGMRLGRGEQRLREEAKPLSDAWEALLGALFLDQGLDAAMAVVEHTIMPHLDAATQQHEPKGRLQIWCQRNRAGAVPLYRVVGREGPDNQPSWQVAVLIGEQELGRGAARNKKEAQQAAAAAALAALGLGSS